VRSVGLPTPAKCQCLIEIIFWKDGNEITDAVVRNQG